MQQKTVKEAFSLCFAFMDYLGSLNKQNPLDAEIRDLLGDFQIVFHEMVAGIESENNVKLIQEGEPFNIDGEVVKSFDKELLGEYSQLKFREIYLGIQASFFAFCALKETPIAPLIMNREDAILYCESAQFCLRNSDASDEIIAEFDDLFEKLQFLMDKGEGLNNFSQRTKKGGTFFGLEILGPQAQECLLDIMEWVKENFDAPTVIHRQHLH